MLLSRLLDIEKLKIEVNRRMVSVRAHPLDPDLRIFNYTHEAAYEGEWTHEQKICRGLIVHIDRHTGLATVVARPLAKFFNYGEHILNHEEIPLDEPFYVSSKEDGSLGILYQAPDGPAIATRGSFESEQATWATNWLRASVPSCGASEGNVARLFGAGVTVLFEIIFQANRIVLDYGDFEGLIHLVTLDNATGRPVEEYQWAGRRAETHQFDHLEDLLGHVATADSTNQEGFVIYFHWSDLRIKVKFASYVALHRILTGLSERRIWEHISAGGVITEFLENVPDELFAWIREVDSRLRMRHDLIIAGLQDRAQKLHTQSFSTRKDLAIAIADDPDRGRLFRAYDGQWDRLSQDIWRSLRPEGNKTFRTDEDSCT
jgi:RNA ligase